MAKPTWRTDTRKEEKEETVMRYRPGDLVLWGAAGGHVDHRGAGCRFAQTLDPATPQGLAPVRKP